MLVGIVDHKRLAIEAPLGFGAFQRQSAALFD
jgi:hypothetical protein